MIWKVSGSETGATSNRVFKYYTFRKIKYPFKTQ